jgi:hypothetical protein
MTKLIPEPLVSFFAPGFEAREQFAQDKHRHVDSVGLGQISHEAGMELRIPSPSLRH